MSTTTDTSFDGEPGSFPTMRGIVPGDDGSDVNRDSLPDQDDSWMLPLPAFVSSSDTAPIVVTVLPPARRKVYAVGDLVKLRSNGARCAVLEVIVAPSAAIGHNVAIIVVEFRNGSRSTVFPRHIEPR